MALARITGRPMMNGAVVTDAITPASATPKASTLVTRPIVRYARSRPARERTARSGWAAGATPADPWMFSACIATRRPRIIPTRKHGSTVARRRARVAGARRRPAWGAPPSCEVGQAPPLGVPRDDPVGYELERVALARGEAAGERALRLLDHRERPG